MDHAVKYSAVGMPRAVCFTAPNTLFEPSIKTVLYSPSQWGSIVFMAPASDLTGPLQRQGERGKVAGEVIAIVLQRGGEGPHLPAVLASALGQGAAD